MTTIVGINVGNRQTTAQEVQRILTEYGCIIRTRLGLHIANEYQCSSDGLILVEIVKDEEAEKFLEAMSKVENVDVQKMKF